METEATEPPGRRPPSGGSGPGCEVEVVDATGRMDPSRVAWVAERARQAVAFQGCGGEVRVRVVGDVEMSAAHLKHLGDAATTDVMTFDMGDGAAARTGRLDVDVLICLDEAERQGARRGHGGHLEVVLYVVHAVLHCLGFDDGDEASAARMHAREDEVLAAIGVGSVYAAPVRGREGEGAGGAPGGRA